MALEYAAGTFTWSSADAVGAIYTVSGLTFQPKAIRFFWSGITASISPSTTSNLNRGVGFATGISDRCSVMSFSEVSAGSAVTATFAANDAVCGVIDGAAGRTGALDINSITASGFTVIVDDQSPISLTIVWEAWGGSDITVAVVGDIAEPAATGSQNYAVAGFAAGATDQVVMFAGVQSTAALNAGLADDSGMHVGFAAGTTAGDNITVCGNSDDGSATMDTDGYCFCGDCLSMITVAGGNPNARASLTAFNDNSFTLNWSARGVTNRRSIFLAIKGGLWRSNFLTIDGATLNSISTVSGLPFTPVGISVVGRMTTQSAAGVSSAHDRISMGAGKSTSNSATVGGWDVDATANATIRTTAGAGLVLSFFNGSNNGFYDLDSINSDGFTIKILSAIGVASEFIGYLTFGNASASDRNGLIRFVNQSPNRASRY